MFPLLVNWRKVAVIFIRLVLCITKERHRYVYSLKQIRGSVSVVELAVERAIDKEEEEKRLRELELLHALEGAGEGEEGPETMGAATET